MTDLAAGDAPHDAAADAGGCADATSPGGEAVHANVSLSSTFDDLPELRDLLLAWPSARLRFGPWQDRSDVAVFARDASPALVAGPGVRREVDATKRFGTIAFVLGRTPWPDMRGRAVPIDRHEQDWVSCLRLVDAIEDHLFHHDLGSGPLPGPDDLGEWLRQDLSAAGVVGESADQLQDLLVHLRAGEFDKALATLLRPDGSPIGGWPTDYVLGRLYGARGWFDDLAPSSPGEVRRSAAEVLDAAYWNLRPPTGAGRGRCALGEGQSRGPDPDEPALLAERDAAVVDPAGHRHGSSHRRCQDRARHRADPPRRSARARAVGPRGDRPDRAPVALPRSDGAAARLAGPGPGP